MDYLIEFLVELILEGTLEASKSKKIPKTIRYFLIGIISLFFILIIGMIILTGILYIKENVMGALFLIILGIIMLILSIVKFRQIYLDKANK